MNSKKLEELINKISKFNHDRGWDPHAQDIAKSIVLEAAELLEHFQWDGGKTIGVEGKNLLEIKHEVADVFWYLVIFCQKTGIDLSEAVELKYLHNEEKYPAEKFLGKHNHDFYMSQKKKYRQNKNIK